MGLVTKSLSGKVKRLHFQIWVIDRSANLFFFFFDNLQFIEKNTKNREGNLPYT